MNSLGTNLSPLRSYDPRKAYGGYTLFAPMGGDTVWMIDMLGRFVHAWRMPYPPGVHGRLLENGHLLYMGNDPAGPLTEFGGSAGVLLEVDWNGHLIWKYEDPYLSHDFYRLDNGHTIIIRWEPIPKEFGAKVKGGLPGTERNGVMWGDVLREINLAGEVLWEWRCWEHFDFDIEVLSPLVPRDRYGDCNSCFVMPNGNIIVSYPALDLIEIIDKQTGNIIWRYGGMGKLSFQHNPTFLENGNILVFDNGRFGRDLPAHSSVKEINPATYAIEWEYISSPRVDFYASFISGCQRLPNGNTLICDGPSGRFFEVIRTGEIVWEYVCPFYFNFSRFGYANMTYRAYRYGPDYPGLKGTGLDDLNRLYSPDTFLSGPTPRVTVEPVIVTIGEGPTQTASKAESLSSGDAVLAERLQARLKNLGY